MFFESLSPNLLISEPRHDLSHRRRYPRRRDTIPLPEGPPSQLLSIFLRLFYWKRLPPQSDTTRDWAKRLAEMVPEARVIVAEDADTAAREIVDAEAAFGWLGSDLLLKATRLRWLQAPHAAPPRAITIRN